ncbi:hypothetical protein RclHR1_07760001 [Rhizophagus clarus]|uniref:RNase H type-1 domain-containing protein n=1 Tax=Rhizophagus clarus TaxID=94130 RepID=A0A2Z6RY61_9GLOM|nr:hypothetical protein RclHR1_07760001 [Rhizophagus clarus]
MDGGNHQPHRSSLPHHKPMDCFISIPHDQRDDNIWINRWIGPSDDKDHFIKIKDSLNSFEELFFYTDGSVQNGVPSHLRQRLDDYLDYRSMVINQGAAFVEIHSNLQFFTRIVNWPSSTRAELFAIFLALLVCLRGCRIKIYTDSNCSISTITRFLCSCRKFCSRGFNNSLILIYIADELAKKGTELTTYHQLIFNFRSQNCRFSPHFEDTLIEQKLRNFLSTIGTVQSCSEWRYLQINEDVFVQRSIQYQWEVTWTAIQQVKHFRCTSSKRNSLWSFIIKILHQQLPVGRWLRKRKPALYRNFYCQFCNNEANETISHLITCPHMAHLRQSIYETLWDFLAITLSQFFDSLSSTTLVTSKINGWIGTSMQSARFMDLFKCAAIGKMDAAQFTYIQRRFKWSHCLTVLFCAKLLV